MLKLLFFLLIGPGAVIFYIPYFLLTYIGVPDVFKTENLQYIGLLPILAGSLVSLRCFFDFFLVGKGTPVPTDPPQKLVVVGLYQISRNPIYVGILIILMGEAVVFNSLALFAYAVFIFCLFHIFIVVYEEPHLHKLFGKEYEKYQNAVPRWIIRFSNK